MISGLVVTLSSEAELSESAIRSIQQQPALEVGPQDQRRLPLVLETNSHTESQEITDWLTSLPGIEFVDVAFVHLDDVQDDVLIDAPPQTVINRS